MTNWLPSNLVVPEIQESALRRILEILNDRTKSMTISHKDAGSSYKFTTKNTEVEIVNQETIRFVSRRTGDGIEICASESWTTEGTKELIKAAYEKAAALVAEYTHPGT